MKKTNRTRRRKGKTRPPTIGKNCRWLDYQGGVAVCGLKIKINDSRDDVKYGGCAVYDDVSCDKCAGCGYEEDVPENSAVRRLSLKMALKSIKRLKEQISDLEERLNEQS